MADAFGVMVVKGAQASPTLTTMGQLVAGTNRRVKVLGISITFNGTVNTDAPVLVEALRQSTAGTSSICTPSKIDPSMVESLITSGLQGFSGAEPTAGDVVDAWYVHPQAGFINPLPLSQEHKIGGGGRFGVRVTATNSVLCTLSIRFEE